MLKIYKILKFIGILLLALLILDFAVVLGFSKFTSNPHRADAILVMGAAINSPALYNRSIEALGLYEAGYAPVIVLSGGRISDKDISEATYMQRVIQNKTKKPLNLILDEYATNTFENIKNAKVKLSNAESVIIVTDKFHIARSVMTAKVQGFNRVYWVAPKGEYFQSRELAFHYFRETLANLAYLWKFLSD